MFGRKKESLPEPKDTALVSVIPVEFYAGASPVIVFPRPTLTNANAPVAISPQSAAKSVMPPTVTKAVVKTNSLLGNRTFVLAGAIGLFVLFVAGASLYYWRILSANRGAQPQPAAPQISVTTPAPTPAPVPVVEVTTTEPTIDTSTPPSFLSGGSIDFPPTALGTSNDSDKDGITDVEEELYKTDPHNPDTDGDGYSDGVETYNLYSPIDSAPAKIIDTNLVTEFLNPTYQYHVYYPTSWAHDRVLGDYSDVLFSTLTGEHVEIRAIDTTTTNFTQWFSQWAPSQQFADLKPFTSRFGVKGYVRSDNLVYYFPSASQVFVLAYNPGSEAVVNYPAVVAMIARSFSLPNETGVIVPSDTEQPLNSLLPVGVTSTSPAL